MQQENQNHLHKQDRIVSWIFRFIKGAIIGAGAILPGVSGGVLSIVFGIYERMMAFFAGIRKNFFENLKFFIPIGLGFSAGFVLLSKVIGIVLKNEIYAPVLIWFFIGAIIGTIPFLFAQAGKNGRKTKHWITLAVSAIGSFCIMIFMKNLGTTESIEPNFFWWIFCGVLVALGAILPGMSPSAILIYMGIYARMSTEIGNLNITMIIPFAIGMVATILLFSKLINWLFNHFHAIMYHIVVGVVISSTIMIIPIPGYTEIDTGVIFGGYNAVSGLFSISALVVGIISTVLLGRLEKKVR